MANHAIGCSSDGLNSDGIGDLEVKCPENERVHMEYLRYENKETFNIPAKHFAQCVGNAWVLDRKYCDFVTFIPRINGPHRMKINRVWLSDCGPYLNNLKRCVYGFEKILKQEMERLNIS